MSQHELQRVRSDLETIRQAAGLAPPIGWGDVWMNLALVPLGLAFAAWETYAPPRLEWIGLLPFAIYVPWATWTFRHTRTHAPARHREHKAGLPLVAVISVANFVFLAWSRRVGMPPMVAGGCALFFLGVLVAAHASTSRFRAAAWPAAISMAVFGMVMPFCTRHEALIAVGLIGAFAGASIAAIQAWQLHSIARVNVPAAN
ncbi:MAG: hypothetical protein NTW19_18460 [Planctomycetota bacterium]|nr:hypothetical protein [Planctomycetota bacterium]